MQSEYCPYGISFSNQKLHERDLQPISQGESHQQRLTPVTDKGLHLSKGKARTFGLD
jgi:hypothetical protein